MPKCPPAYRQIPPRVLLRDSLLPVCGVEGADVPDAFLDEIEATLTVLPAGLLKTLRPHGYVVYTAPTLCQLWPRLARRQPRGWPKGMTWESSDGGYFHVIRAVAVTQQYRDFHAPGYENSYEKPLIPSPRMPFILLHELGHAIDFHAGVGHRLAKRFSCSAAFKAAYAADTRLWNRSARKKHKYCIQYFGKAGREEAFANIFSSLYGQFQIEPPEQFLGRFPKTRPLVEAYISQLVSQA